MKSAEEEHLSQLQLLTKEKMITAKQKQILFISLVGLSLITFFIVWQIILNRKQNKIKRLHLENELKVQKLEKYNAVAEFEKKATELEMQALRAQMNPHFIFNSLNSINSFILKNNSSEASRYLTKFSKLIRMILQHSQSSMIPLQDELGALHLFIQLEQLRFSNHFEYSIHVPDDLNSATFFVPPLIIQPYVENAIWHGLMPKKGNGRIDIEFVPDEEFVVCKISDDGIGRKKGAEIKQAEGSTYKSLGMRITLERMCLLNKNENGNGNGNPLVSVVDRVLHDGSAGGTIVYIKIPRNYD
jgi:LytS/YehU family sensor histidine kinase